MPRRKDTRVSFALAPARLAALRHLAEAHRTALEVGLPPEEFACELASLERHGITETVLRWLIEQKLVKHRLETTRRRGRRRTFRETSSMRFVGNSCFQLTSQGARLAETIAAESAARRPARRRVRAKVLRPRYDRELRTLFLGDKIVKCFRVPARNQELVLLAFEEDGWPARIDDPHPQSPDIEPKQRLHDTLKRLNRHQRDAVIRFTGDGTGHGICWSLP